MNFISNEPRRMALMSGSANYVDDLKLLERSKHSTAH
jgi:hypothetical protein